MRNILFCLFIFASFLSEAQVPFIENYGPKTYKAASQNWCIAQDNRGMMYFGNSDGLLEYDGSHWHLISVPGFPRSLYNYKNKLYIGTATDMGYLATAANGKIYFHSLKKFIPKNKRDFNTVWWISSFKNLVYFVTENDVYVYNINKHSFNIIPISGNQIWAYQVYNQTYIEDSYCDMLYIKDGKLLKDSALSTLCSQGILGLLPYKNHKILIATRDNGINLYAIKNGIPHITHIKSKLDTLLKKYSLYSACPIKTTNGSLHYAFGTRKNGIYISDASGNILLHLNQENGIRRNNISCLFQDKEGELWAGLSSGISKIDISSPFRIYDHKSGLALPILSVCRYKGILFVGTNLGLYWLDSITNRFNHIKNITTQCWKLQAQKDRLLVDAGNHGLYFVKIGKNNNIISKQMFSKGSALMDFLVSKKDSSILFCAMYNGFIICRITQTGIEEIGKIKNIHSPCYGLAQAQNGDIWVNVRAHGFYRISFPTKITNKLSVTKAKIEKYGANKGVNATEGLGIISTKNQIYFIANNKICLYDSASNRFNEDTAFNKQFHLKNNHNLSFFKDENGNFWFPGMLKIAYKTGNKFTLDSLSLKPLQAPCRIVYFDNDKSVWISNQNGLYHYFPKQKIKKRDNFPTLIMQASLLDNDSVIFYGSAPRSGSNNPIPILTYKYNSINFQYAALSYDFESKTLFKYRLKGYNNKWSKWTKDTYVSYTNLPEGNYTFCVKSKSALGYIGKTATYKFTILPPWYHTIWAYALYVILFILFVYFSIRISLYRMRKSKKQLENLVLERTKEISAQKSEIEEKNKSILNSIQYARYLQNAILPNISILNNYFNDCFVLFMPKDILSGDFYWFSQKVNQKGKIAFIAAADCTGHGVPGAMTSIFCSNALNHVVNELNAISPADILNKTRQLIIEHYTNKEKAINDGMDIALCKFTYTESTNPQTVQLDYSGANNPLWIVRKGVLDEIKGDKQPVGNYVKYSDFTNHNIELKKDDLIYIFSDGFADQFGGEKGKKYKYSHLKETLLSISKHDLNKQKTLLEEEFKRWKGELEQVDDVCIIGIKV